MSDYILTVFSKEGEKLLDETFVAANEAEAKEIGKRKLAEANYSEYTHRCVASKAKLVLFHR